MKKQSVTDLKSLNELIKQTKLNWTLIDNKKPDSPNVSSSKNISYAEAVQLSLIVPKLTSSQTLSKDQINDNSSQALDKIKEASAKVTEMEKY